MKRFKLTNIFRDTKGMTMVELIVATLIAAILMITLSLFIPAVYKLFQSSISLSNATIVQSTVESVFKRELQYAKSVHVIQAGDAVSFIHPKFGDSTITILKKSDSNTADAGLPVLQTDEGYYPLFEREDLGLDEIDLSFTHDKKNHILKVTIQFDQSESTFSIDLLNEKDNGQ